MNVVSDLWDGLALTNQTPKTTKALRHHGEQTCHNRVAFPLLLRRMSCARSGGSSLTVIGRRRLLSSFQKEALDVSGHGSRQALLHVFKQLRNQITGESVQMWCSAL